MKRILILLALVFLFAGCGQSVKYVCSDGSVVSDASKCPPSEEYKAPVTEPTVMPTDVFTLKKGESMAFEGKDVKLVDVLDNGRTIFSVSGVKTEIKGTKELEIINGLEVFVDKVNYVFVDPASSNAYFKLRMFVPNASEYLFFTDTPQNVDGIQVTLTGVTPTYVLVDGGNVRGMKIYAGSSKEIDGLNVTNVRAFPHGIRVEDYAILRIVKV